MFVVRPCISRTQVSTSIRWSSIQNQYQKGPINMAAICTAFIHIHGVHLLPQFSFQFFFSVAVGLFVPFWYWHWLNKVSTPPLLFSPSCNKNIISFIFPRTLNYWLLIAPIERWSDDPRHSTLDDLSLNHSVFLQDSIFSFFFVQRAPQIRLCVSLIDMRQLRRTSHANLLLVAN